MIGTPLTVTDPVVRYRETVLEATGSAFFAKSPNKRNSMSVELMPAQLPVGIDHMRVVHDPKGGWGQTDFLARTCEGCSYPELGTGKVWVAGPDASGPNWCFDAIAAGSAAEEFVPDVKPHISYAFQLFTSMRPLCEEPCRGVVFRVLDVDTTSTFRNLGQIVPAARRVMTEGVLASKPALMQPVYRVEITVPHEHIASALSVMTKRHAELIDQEQAPREAMLLQRYNLPVTEATAEDVRSATGGMAAVAHGFSHWAVVEGDIYDASSAAHETLTAIQIRKGLRPGLPPLDESLSLRVDTA